jgi:hypothetical protein
MLYTALLSWVPGNVTSLYFYIPEQTQSKWCVAVVQGCKPLRDMMLRPLLLLLLLLRTTALQAVLLLEA